MPKFQRQATHANESDILQIIDERFEELEETVALARLIPQIHDRLFDVEQMLKRLEVAALVLCRRHAVYLTCRGGLGPETRARDSKQNMAPESLEDCV